MAVYTVYHDVVVRKYRAHVCSSATLFFICLWIITILGPLFIAYNTIGFWLRESTYHEQPEVSFKHQFILFLEGESINTLIGYSTHDDINTLLGDNLRIPVVKSYERDENHDGKNDLLMFYVEMPLFKTERIHSMQVVLFFDYSLHLFPSLRMECLAYVPYASPLPGEEFFSDGMLKFQQKSPLPHRGSYTMYNKSLISEASHQNQRINLQNLFSVYQLRNVTTDFVGKYPVWRSGRADNFKISLRVTYPLDRIVYRPGFWQVIKFAWIQYLSTLFLFLFVLGRVKKFVFENQLVPTIAQKLHQQ